MSARATIELVCDDGKVWREVDTGRVFTLADDDCSEALQRESMAVGVANREITRLRAENVDLLENYKRADRGLRECCDSKERIRAENERAFDIIGIAGVDKPMTLCEAAIALKAEIKRLRKACKMAKIVMLQSEDYSRGEDHTMRTISDIDQALGGDDEKA